MGLKLETWVQILALPLMTLSTEKRLLPFIKYHICAFPTLEFQGLS